MKSNKNMILNLFFSTTLLSISSLLAASPFSGIVPPVHEDCELFDLDCLVQSITQTAKVSPPVFGCIKDGNTQLLSAEALKEPDQSTGVPEQPCK